MDPKRILDKLPRFDRDKPFRYLGRRVVQAMAEAATTNMVIGQRSAPGRYLVIHLAADAGDKESWEQQWAESRAAIHSELEREAAARDIKLRSALGVELLVITDQDARSGEAERALSAVLDADEVPPALARLLDEREITLPRRVRSLTLESDPPQAQAYVDHRPVGVTPCRVDDLPEGDHRITFACPGYLPFEETYRIEPGRSGQRPVFRGVLRPEPDMGVLDIRTFPPRARVTIGDETRDAPSKWRLPAGDLQLRIELEDYEPQTLEIRLPKSTEERPYRVQVRLRYSGSGRDEVVGRLIVYRPGTGPTAREPDRRSPDTVRISEFFRADDSLDEWDLPNATPASPRSGPEVLGEKPLHRGVFLIGREDPGGTLQPDIRLFDPENSVSRGCHAWIWVYADRSTGADYNTFLVGNNSPTGIRVDGALVMETRRLFDDSELEIGNFRMRVVKEVPQARVEFDF